MRKTFLLLSVLMLASFISLSQESEYTEDTLFVRKQLNACKDIIFKNPDQAKPFIDSAFNRSKKYNYSDGLYSAHNYAGIRHFMMSDYEESIIEYRNALKFADKDKLAQKLRLLSNISLSHRFLNNQDSALYYLLIVYEESKLNQIQDYYQQSVLDIATYYLDKEDFVTAVQYFSETENYCETSEDTVFLVKAYSSLARFYHSVDDFDRANDAFQKAIMIDKLCDDINFIAANYANLGESYLRLKNNYDTAIYFYRKSLSLSLPYAREKQNLLSQVNIGNAYLESERMDSAFFYYLQAYNNDLINNYPKAKAAVLINLGLFYNRKGNSDKSYEFLTQGLKLAKDLKIILYQKNALKELSSLEKNRANYKASLEYHESYHLLSDSLKNITARHQLALENYEKLMIKEKFNNEFLSHQNEDQKNQIITQRIIILLTILAGLSLSILLLVFWKSRKTTKALNKSLQLSNDQLETTNLKLIEQKEEMKALLMSKDRFVSMLGHDLKNPFSGLLGLLELMLEDWDSMPESEKKHGIYQLSISAKQTYDFLQSLLDWGKAQQGLIKSNPEKFVLNDIAEELLAIFYAQYSKKRIKINIDIRDNFEVYTDRKLISQILQNFLTNAIKYSHNGDNIVLQASREAAKVRICVKDSGIGIPEGKINDLFKLDSNYNRLGTAGESSTGMGLILSREYADLLGGEIKVYSQVDVGSEFCIIIDA